MRLVLFMLLTLATSPVAGSSTMQQSETRPAPQTDASVVPLFEARSASTVSLTTASRAAIELSPLALYTRETDVPGEGDGMWCADPARSGTAFGITTVATPEHGVERYDGRVLASQNLLVQRTADGGRSWRQTLRSSEIGAQFDPACAFGLDGVAYVAAMAWPVTGARGFDLWASVDHGASWGERRFVPYPEFYDRPFLSIDTSASRYHGRLYIAAATVTVMSPSSAAQWPGRTPGRIVIMSSDDRGRTFSPPVHIETSVGVGDGTVHMGQTGVFSDGSYLVSWSEGEIPSIGLAGLFAKVSPRPPTGEPTFRFELKTARSRDGGTTFDTARSLGISQWGAIVDGYTIRSGKWYSALAIDHSSGPRRDHAYLVWNAVIAGRSQIHFSRSTNRGDHWSKPRVIAFAQIFDAADRGAGPHRVMPSIAVNRDGIVGVTFYQSARPGKNGAWQSMFIGSNDGGHSWSEPVPLSTAALITPDLDGWSARRSGLKSPTAMGSRLPPVRAIGSFPTCRWDLIVDANGDFLAFPISTPQGLWTTIPVRIKLTAKTASFRAESHLERIGLHDGQLRKSIE